MSGHADDADAPFGTYVDAKVRRTGLIGTVALVALGLAAALLGLLGEVPWGDAGLAALTGLAGATWIWAMAVRPRFEVSGRGVVVVNAVRTTEIPWAEVEAFDCGYSLTVYRSNGDPVTVAALPASGLRRIVSGAPGRVDRLAMELNAFVASSAEPGSAPARVSVETPEGRRDLRVLAVLATLGVATAAAVRHLLG